MIGVVGLSIAIATNFAALLIFGKASAEFFSHAWWSTWFPGYLVWISFLILGIAGLMIKKEPNQSSQPSPERG